MPVVYLVRHGQASFGSDDYDVLSDLGRRQAALAGAELARRDLGPAVVVSGSLVRQQDTAGIVAQALGVEEVTTDARFDEFDAHSAVDAWLGGSGATDGLTSAQFQVHLDEVMAHWAQTSDPGWVSFVDGAWAALSDVVVGLPRGAVGVVATSAGVTAALAGRALGGGAATVIAMNRVSVNASITMLVSGSRGVSLVTFNEHAHLLGEPGLRTNR
jgi:broad specificity phosphatase PhoE